ncbi:MAG: PAS domain S-box protein [Pseudohongiella sp.]|nr:PAS domain S-box protein [Pseudohongiella sp.]
MNRESLDKLNLRDLDFGVFLEAASDALIIVNEEGSIELVNQKLEALSGYSKEELQGRPVEILVPSKSRKKHQLNLKQYVKDPTTRYMGDIENIFLRTIEETEIPVAVSLSPIKAGEELFILATIRDMTKWKQAEQDLRASKSGLDEAQRLAHIGSWELDLVLNKLLWSDEIYRLFGLEPQQFSVTYETFLEYVHPDDRALVDAAYLKSVETREPYDIEHRLLLKDGSIKTVRERCKSFYDDNGKAIRSIGTVQDITSGKEQQRELRRFRAAIDASPDSIYFTDPDSMRFLYVNRTAAKRTGYSQTQLLEMGPEDILNYNRNEIERDYAEAIASGEKGVIREVERKAKNNAHSWSEVRRHALQLDDHWTIITISRDITERKNRDNEMLQFRAAMDVSPDMVFVTDYESMRFIYANKMAAQQTGFSQEELLQKGPQDVLLYDRHELDSMYNEVIAAGEQGTVTEVKTQGADNVRSLAEVHRRALYLDDRWIIVTISQDISLRKRAERELQSVYEELEHRVEERTLQLQLEIEQRKKASQVKNLFLSSMSHELRTPLNSILGYAQLIELGEAESNLDDEQREYLLNILSSGEHLLKLITDVLELNTVEEGQMSLLFDHVPTVEIIEDCLNQIQFRAREKNIQIIDQCCNQRAMPRLWTDAARLKQVLLNLLSNAINYSEEGDSVTISCKELPGNMLRISVADIGAGIPHDRRDDLFAPFERLGRETGPIAGTGIGLYIAKRMIKLLKGNIGYESEEGQGSTFWIEMPLSQEQGVTYAGIEPAAKLAAKRSTSSNEDSTSRVILYIEDDPDNMRLMENILTRFPALQIEMLKANNAELGIELAKKNRPDVILMDINLPGMSGIEAARKLKNMEETKAIPLIAVSADATPLTIETALAGGIEAYITKPIGVRQIHQIINKILRV